MVGNEIAKGWPFAIFVSRTNPLPAVLEAERNDQKDGIPNQHPEEDCSAMLSHAPRTRNCKCGSLAIV